MANKSHKQYQFRRWVKWLVAICATLALVVLAWEGTATGTDVAMYAVLLYVLTTVRHTQRGHVSN